MRAVPMRRGELRVDEVPDPVPGPGEVLVKTLACGICGSDLHMVQRVQRSLAGNDDGSPDFRFDNDSDVIMGHEFCAEILEFGADCEEALPVGQRVVSVPGVPRGDARISLAYGNELPGGYSERMVLSEALMIPVPDNVTTEEAAMTEPMAVGRHGVEMSRLEDMPADTVPVVIGCGPVGLSVIADLRRRGIERIVAADFSAKRRELASTMGATNVVDPNDVPTFDAWRAEVGTSAGAVDEPSALVFECVGVPGMIQGVIDGIPRNSQAVVVGVCMEPDTIRPLSAIGKQINLQFVLGYTPEEFASTLASMAAEELDPRPIVTGRVDLDGVPAAFETLASPDEHAKILVVPGGG